MSDEKKKSPPESNYEEISRALIEKEWDEIFKNMNVDADEYKIFLSLGSKLDDGGGRGGRLAPKK